MSFNKIYLDLDYVYKQYKNFGSENLRLRLLKADAIHTKTDNHVLGEILKNIKDKEKFSEIIEFAYYRNHILQNTKKTMEDYLQNLNNGSIVVSSEKLRSTISEELEILRKNPLIA